MSAETEFAEALAKFQAEEWRPVVGIPGYEVSDIGGARSLDRVVMRRNGSPCTRRGQVLKLKAVRGGHLRVSMGSHWHLVHRVVLEAFVGPAPTGTECCHNNGDPADNRLSNLRWDTRTGNILDSVRHGTHSWASRTNCPLGHTLALPNLTRSMLPYRQCLACNRARARVRWFATKGVIADVRGLADGYYASIMVGAA